MMVKDIEKLLAEGATPEQIYQEALRVVEAKSAAAKKMEQEKKNKREAAMSTMIEYMELLTGEKVTDFMKKQLEIAFDEIEELIKSTSKLAKKTETKSDDDKLTEFLRSIGAM